MTEQFFESRTLMYAAALITFLIAVVLILLIFRLAFGRRVRLPGGRTRQQRLGLVEAFDLDRQRQLLIVRRDNTEHLIMVGGPNDLLIEAEIIRIEGRARENEAREPSLPLRNGIPWPANSMPPGASPSPAFGSQTGVPIPGQSWSSDQSVEFPLAGERTVVVTPGIEPAPPPPEPVYRASPPPPEFPPASEPSIPQPQFAQAPRREPGERPVPPPPRVTPAPPTMPPRTPTYPMPPKRPLPPLGTLGNRVVAARDQGQTASGQPVSPAAAFPRAPITTPVLRPLPSRLATAEQKAGGPSAPPSAAPLSTPETTAPTTTTEAQAPQSSPSPAENIPSPLAVQEPQETPRIVSQEPAPMPEEKPAPAEKPADITDSLEEEMAKLLGRSPSES
ncbi:hypothetical protein [Beijerinckia mobilis]|uniref:hypothetical protein n=1 Tax=Beijerinckia mobilis TaxID=231434 RepID=UPI0012EC7E80|nr:hypothetical protein [Beijerinckia mobilis]